MSIIYALVGTNRVLRHQILTIKLLLVISIVFVFLGTPCINECMFQTSNFYCAVSTVNYINSLSELISIQMKSPKSEYQCILC